MKKGTKLAIILGSVAAVLIAAGVCFFLLFAQVDGQLLSTSVTELDLSDRDMTSVDGLSRFRKLEKLDLSGNPIENYEGLMNCDSLRELDLSDCGLTFEQCDALRDALPECFILWDVEILGKTYSSDITKITLLSDDLDELRKIVYLPRLERADLTGCEVEDEELYAIACELPDTAVVWEVELNRNTSLSTDTEDIENFYYSYGSEKLRYFTQAKTLRFMVDSETDLSVLTEMRSLEDLYIYHLDGEEIDFAPLGELTGLLRLDMQNSKPDTIDWISSLTELRYLCLRNTPIGDISALAPLTKLEQLVIGSCGVFDLSPLSGMTSMRSLVIGGNAIKDISVLENMPELQFINMSSCENITDCSALSKLTKLTDLQAMECGITDISWAAELTSLTDLYLDHNPIEDISALSGLTQLQNLGLSGIGKLDISPLEPLTSLKCLFLDENEIDDISPLLGMSKMSQLSMVDVKVSAADKSALKKALPDDCAILYSWDDYFSF